MITSDKVPSYLRTFVPALWGTFVAWLLLQLPGIPEPVVMFLQSDAPVALFTGLVILAWYWVARKLEVFLPPWLTRIILGSNLTPEYERVGVEAVAYPDLKAEIDRRDAVLRDEFPLEPGPDGV